MPKFQTNPKTQVEIEALMNALLALGPDDLLTYTAMNQLVGYPVRQTPWAMLRARDRAEQETGLRFATVRGEGLVRLTADNLPGIGMAARSRIGRIAKRNGQRLTDLRGYNKIDRRLRARLDAERSLLGAIGEVASTKGDNMASRTKTGPIVAAEVFGYVSPPAKQRGK
jgi:hypothetical protein